MTAARLWLAAPTRFAALSSRHARIALFVLAASVSAAIATVDANEPVPQHRAVQQDDIVAALRHGGDYYPLVADALRRAGAPLTPFTEFRLPALAAVEAWLPPLLVLLLLVALAAGTLIAWYRLLTPALPRRTVRLVATALLAASLSVVVRPDLLATHETWATILVALSLAVRRPGAALTAIAIGLAAMLIRETATLYAAIMAVAAFIEGQRREAAGWLAAIGALAVVLLAHAWAVSLVVRPLDAVDAAAIGLLGPGEIIRAVAAAWSALPAALAAPLAVLALLGWSALRGPVATRVLAMLAGYALLLAVVSRPDGVAAALLPLSLLAIGLAFAPDALRDLCTRALDTRRITVTRMVR